ncbi:hypothetical protein [uncultured Psychroserpens sp.]|uniref:hypothetical protein n=1 Tax=uncultured Psychroserpens sp. TaxID=255436 RepID=UPI00260C56ED|nr:hypothetical protein [uncultured Psychroserpens sp.]
MKVINQHTRLIDQPKAFVSQLFDTLATKNDRIWPKENWPAMKFKDGLQIGNNGGHGRIRYTIIEFEPGCRIKFKFLKPDGFYGTHELVIESVSEDSTEIRHEIRMKTSIKGYILWITMIRWLHDALIEDAFDKVENQFLSENKETSHSFWVRCLRSIYKRKLSKTKQV